MVATPSTMLSLGTELPEFSLRNAVDGRNVSSIELAGDQATLVMFICNHCPFVKHVRAELARLGRDYMPRGVGVVAISANDADAKPEDAPAEMKRVAQEGGWEFPYLFDETQEVAKTFMAACTPDFYLFDGDEKLVYRGQLDGSRPGNDVPVTGTELRGAIDAVLAGRPVPRDQTPSLGCNIKWKPGNEPAYVGGKG